MQHPLPRLRLTVVSRSVVFMRGKDIYAMIGVTIYSGYNKTEQQFLLDMCIADEFTAAQATYITENPDTRAIIKSLAQSNAFIRYLPDTNTYRFHHMLRGYAEQLALRLRYGQWHESQGQYIQSLRFYGEAGSMSGVLRVIGLDRGILLASINPQDVLTLLARCSEEELTAEPQARLDEEGCLWLEGAGSGNWFYLSE